MTTTTDRPGNDDSIDVLGLSARVSNALRRDHITTIADLAATSAPELRDIPRFGSVALAEVRTALERQGLALREPGAS